MSKQKKSLWSYVGSGVAVAATAVAGSIATNPKSLWFKTLDKPAWQPPSWLFPIVWTALYTDIALVSGKVLADAEEEGDSEQASAYRKALLLNLVLNFGWSYTFFTAKKLGLSTVVAAALAASSSDLAKKAGRSNPTLGTALLPYSVWTSFATALTTELWRRNRGRD